MYMKEWNDVVEIVEGITSDIIDYMRYCEDEDQALSDISHMIAYYTLMVIKKYSSKS